MTSNKGKLSSAIIISAIFVTTFVSLCPLSTSSIATGSSVEELTHTPRSGVIGASTIQNENLGNHHLVEDDSEHQHHFQQVHHHQQHHPRLRASNVASPFNADTNAENEERDRHHGMISSIAGSHHHYHPGNSHNSHSNMKSGNGEALDAVVTFTPPLKISVDSVNSREMNGPNHNHQYYDNSSAEYSSQDTTDVANLNSTNVTFDSIEKCSKHSEPYGERLTDGEMIKQHSVGSCADDLKQPFNDSIITLGFLSPYNQNQLVVGAMRLAVEKVNNDPNLLPGKTLRYIAADIGSSDLMLATRPIEIMTEMRDRGTVGFIGGPEDTCVSEALVAAAWNLPMISYKCSDQRVSDKKTYRTFARTLPPSSKVSKSVVELLKAFKWNKIMLVMCPTKKDRWHKILIDAFTNLARKHKIEITDHYSLPDFIPNQFAEMERIVRESFARTRVYVFFGEHVALVHLIKALADKKAFDNGEYIVISIDDKLGLDNFFQDEYVEIFEGNKTVNMIKAYRSVLRLMQSNPQAGYFGNDVKNLIKNYSINQPFCTPFHRTIFKDALVPIEAAYLHDAVMIYAHALSKALKDGIDPRNGTAIFDRIRNTSYHSLQGFDVFIDENGDAEGNYTVTSLLPVEDDYDYGSNESIGNFPPSYTSVENLPFFDQPDSTVKKIYEYWDPQSNTTVRLRMLPVGYFTQVASSIPSVSTTSSSSGASPGTLNGNVPDVSLVGVGNTQSGNVKAANGNHNRVPDKFEAPADDIAFRYFNESRPIHWVGGKPPKAEPSCGFQGEYCVYKPDWRTISVCSIAGAVLAIALVIAARHYRYEQKLACLLWKIDMQQVVLISSGPPEPVNGTKNTVAICRQLLNVDAEAPLELSCKKAYTRVGFYKGMAVAVKPIYKRSIDLTRNIRKELIQIREVRHENIIPFIGASVDHGNICILTAYSARGSLEDVLLNEDLHLDNMFLASLVADLIKGMIYLHESEIISHGNLKSSNCMVDSRWVLQIADFGLHEFKGGQENKGNTEKEIRKLLWRAPELLRDPNAPLRGTQKGDVYSFGIILYEMIGRSGPWGKTQLSIPEIIEKVTNPELVDPSESETGFLRPSTLLLDCGETILKCLEACWEEDADLRPDFRFIRIRLKEMQAGLKPNIFDNMLSIMEKYACNLEDLVQERTIQLMEEKKKTDALLHRMLPKSVADALKRGDPVEAESFDSVTIYFSDIVGFTALSAVSTPLQVVELLNDLYTCFDSIISNYDVYKVETIGDAYMVVSGLPIRNGNQHAGEIASMALHLLDRIKGFEIPHRPGERLKLRIGIHTGCVVAGVVGLSMPRYCLFGDTVNTASRMESSGEALKVHISNVTKSVLEQIGGYYYEERGIIPIKGKGEMRTFWLTGEDTTRTRKNSTESTSLTTEHEITNSVQQSPPNGVIGFGQDGEYNFDLNEVAAVTNNNFQTFACDNASDCQINGNVSSSAINQGNSKNNKSSETEPTVGLSTTTTTTKTSPRESPSPNRSPSENEKNFDLVGSNQNLSNGKVAYKPTTWLLAECQTGKADHHDSVIKSIGGRHVSCSNVFQECKVNIIKELKKNGNTAAAAAAAAAFACNNGRIGNHLHNSGHQHGCSTNRFRSAPIITFMETSAPNPNSAPRFSYEERNFV